MKEFTINLTNLYSPKTVRLITKYFSDIFSLKTCNNEVAEFGVHLIAKCALKSNNYGIQ